MSSENVLLRASFDSRLKTYGLLVGAGFIVVGVVTIPLVLIWFLGVGQAIIRRQYESLECELTERSLNFSRGFLVRIQKNVPLDKITDLAVIEGPILRYLGLVKLKVETAGQSSASGALLSLIGIEEPLAFRDAVLRQRDLVTSAGPLPQPDVGGGDAVLRDIRDSLVRIEALMRRDHEGGAPLGG